MTPVVISFTQNYVVPAAVTVSSILSSSDAKEKFEFICLLAGDLPEDMKTELQRMTGERAIWRFLNLQGQLGDVYVDPRYSEAASYRLLMPEILLDLDKVIYLDCDIVVRNDIAQLYNTVDLGTDYLAAVYEAPLVFQIERFRAIGCDPAKYFNSGFLIMNLAQMRQEGVSADLIDALRVDYLEFPDQDALNQVCKGRVLPLPPYYNSIRTFFLPQYKADFLKQYSESDWGEVQNHGTIHYTGGKPWNTFTVQFGEWWRYYEMIPPSLRCHLTLSGRMIVLHRVYSTSMGRNVLEGVRRIKRAAK